jgi:RNA polymerase sigma factor (sigma-70 family)
MTTEEFTEEFEQARSALTLRAERRFYAQLDPEQLDYLYTNLWVKLSQQLTKPIWNRLQRYQFRPYVYTSYKNFIYGHLNHMKRSTDALTLAPLTGLPASAYLLPDTQEREAEITEEVNRHVEEILTRIPARLIMIGLFYYQDKLPQHEIGTRIGISQPRVHILLKKFRAYFTKPIIH